MFDVIVTCCDWRVDVTVGVLLDRPQVDMIVGVLLDSRVFLGGKRRIRLVDRRAVASITNLVERLSFHDDETMTRVIAMIERKNKIRGVSENIALEGESSTTSTYS